VPRPCCPRRINCKPEAAYFKPVGIPPGALREVVVSLDEIEALRLADLNCLYQEKAAERMNVSRQTFARIVEAARKKVADALTNGKAIRLEGGTVMVRGGGNMPDGNGKGPMSARPGTGRDPCGCDRRRGWNSAGAR